MIHWLQKHLFRRSSKSNINGACLTDLPDNIAMNILSRLPLRCILNLQTVCKKWLALTSSQYFAETHFKSAASSQISVKNELDLFLFDPEAERYKLVKIMPNGFIKVEMIAGGVSPMLVGSCNGLLVFQMFRGSRYLVWDLVAREHAYIDAPSPSLSLSAILFDPSSTQEGGYKLLFSGPIVGQPGFRYEFFFYESTNNTWRKLSTSSLYPPTRLINHSINEAVVNPTVYKRCIFWMAPWHQQGIVDNPPCRSSVVIFDMDVEEFRSMPHPGSECKPTEEYAHKHMYFFEEKGQLYFCHNFFKTFSIWSLEGYDRWYWVKKHEFRLYHVLLRLSSSSVYVPYKKYGFDLVKFIKIEGDAIYFQCCYRGLFRYDWSKDKVKRLDKRLRGCYELSGMKRIYKPAKFTYSDSSLSLESGFRCRKSRGRIHGAVI